MSKHVYVCSYATAKSCDNVKKKHHLLQDFFVCSNCHKKVCSTNCWEFGTSLCSLCGLRLKQDNNDLR